MKIILRLLFILLLISCKKEAEIKYCEIEKYGSVTVINEFGVEGKIDVQTIDFLYLVDGKLVLPGKSLKFEKVEEGPLYISFTRDDYFYLVEDRLSLSACQDLVYTFSYENWFADSIPGMAMTISKDGEILEIITDFDSHSFN